MTALVGFVLVLIAQLTVSPYIALKSRWPSFAQAKTITDVHIRLAAVRIGGGGGRFEKAWAELVHRRLLRLAVRYA
ncbi:hypothetical protein HWV62_45334 [Athelia sp. TMB]|nr:hypothetical protein HWV62_45334 [Athelia sp. TMB]